MSEAMARTRRAPTACSWCRYRKVRCDASILGCPCTRCRQDGRSNCVLRATFRQYRAPRGQARLLPGPDHVERQSHPDARTCAAVSDRRDGGDVQRRLECPFVDSQFLSLLPPEDVAYLTAKGSRTVPDESAIGEFFRQYFRHIHPIVPVVDEANFWRIYQGGSDAKLSLFVFQAILFASCTFVSLETLRRCGFDDKRDARKQLHNRAKLLFDLKAEARPSAKAQGAVLLTHHTSAEEPQAGSLWLMRAIESAMLIDAQPSLVIDNFGKSLKKRLWWSILLRDRSLCIGLRRRPQVYVEYWDWLEEDDFEDEIQHSQVYDKATKRQLFQVLQEQCRLAVLLSDLVSLVFVPRGISSCFLTMAEFDGLMSTIERINRSLVEWEIKTPFPPPTPTGPTDLDGPVAILTNLTFMYLHAARVDLAQYAAYMIEGNLSFARDTYTQRKLEIGQHLKRGIEGLTLAMEYFSIKGHLASLPLSVLGYVGMPLILAAVDLKLSSSHEEMMARKKRLDSLSIIIRHSRTLYDVTDYVAIGINHILKLAYLTTKNIFLQWRRPYEIESIETPQSGRSLRTHSSQQSSKLPGRATSWVHAFMCCPRAYLLISTSVDYSLAVGRLPYDNALPELVRHIPAMGAVFTLPWTINAHPAGKREQRSFITQCSSNNQPRVRHDSPESDEQAQSRPSRDQFLLALTGALQDDDNDDDSALPGPEAENTGNNHPTVNLNYMDLGGLPTSPSPVNNNNVREVVANPENRGMERESDHGDVGAMGTPFDSSMLDELTCDLFGEDWDSVE